MKYSKSFERDYNWYRQHESFFDFDGVNVYYNNKGQSVINFNSDGKTAKESFYLYDCQGKITETKEPELLEKLFKTKGSINFHIKMWAESRADGTLPRVQFNEIIKEYDLLDWMVKAVENQKFKYYE